MTIKIKLLLYCATCLNISWAQSAMDYFHSSANYYVDGQFEDAINTIDEGLLDYPDDPNLNSLSGKLKIQKHKPKQQQQQENEVEKKEKKQEQQQSEKSEQGQQDQHQPQAAQEDQEKQQDLQHAQDILDALKKDEKVNQKRQMAKARSKKLEKDW